MSQNAPARCRQANREARFHSLRAHAHRRAGEHLLGGGVYANFAAVPRAAPMRETARPRRKLLGEVMLQAHAAAGILPQFRREARYTGGKANAESARRGKRVALHVLNAQGKVAVVVSPCNVLVSLVAAPIQALEAGEEGLHEGGPMKNKAAQHLTQAAHYEE